MNITQQIINKLNDALNITHLDVIDESSKHIGHSSYKEGGETHFKIKIISNDFNNKSRLKRHRLINHNLRELLSEQIHALSITALTETEANKNEN